MMNLISKSKANSSVCEDFTCLLCVCVCVHYQDFNIVLAFLLHHAVLINVVTKRRRAPKANQKLRAWSTHGLESGTGQL